MKQKRVVLIAATIILLLGIVVGGLSLTTTKGNRSVPTPAIQQAQTFSYKGEAGKDALTILKEKAPIELASSGLVTSINGRKAYAKKHEYWAFYVNGKLADIGPASYQTKTSDTILWKIETY